MAATRAAGSAPAPGPQLAARAHPVRVARQEALPAVEGSDEIGPRGLVLIREFAGQRPERAAAHAAAPLLQL